MASPSLKPVVLLVNCLDSSIPAPADAHSLAHPLNLLKDIPRLTPSAEEPPPGSNVQKWDWVIDNKYYAAEIQYVVIPSPLLPGVANPALDDDLAQRVEALVLCCGKGKTLSKSSFNLIKHWKPFVDCHAPSVRLAVCEGFEEETQNAGNGCVPFSEVMEWCIENQFELVQLDEEEEEEEEDDYDNGGCESGFGKPFASGEYGVPRILAALNAHMWSNLTMKDAKSSCFGQCDDAKQEGEEECKDDSIADSKDRETKSKNPEAVEGDLGAMLGSLGIGEDIDDDEETFEQLFNKMAHLKSQSENLQFEDRKVFAEKVTMAFWRAIGGDDDEIDGLDDVN